MMKCFSQEVIKMKCFIQEVIQVMKYFFSRSGRNEMFYSRGDPNDEHGDEEKHDDGAGEINLLFALLILK
jgi:hypothetical protein